MSVVASPLGTLNTASLLRILRMLSPGKPADIDALRAALPVRPMPARKSGAASHYRKAAAVPPKQPRVGDTGRFKPRPRAQAQRTEAQLLAANRPRKDRRAAGPEEPTPPLVVRREAREARVTARAAAREAAQAERAAARDEEAAAAREAALERRRAAARATRLRQSLEASAADALAAEAALAAEVAARADATAARWRPSGPPEEEAYAAAAAAAPPGDAASGVIPSPFTGQAAA
jgi:hypothetical protein